MFIRLSGISKEVSKNTWKEKKTKDWVLDHFNSLKKKKNLSYKENPIQEIEKEEPVK